MATSITTSLPQWLTGGTYDTDGGNDLRNSDITAGWLDTGILTGSSVGVWPGVTSGAALKVTTATGMAVTVAPGSFVVPNSGAPSAGGYKSTLASSGTLTVATSDPVNPRIDLVVAYVSDVGTSSSFGAVEIITGTPAGSPSAPAAPANSVPLAQVTVPANATSIITGDIADIRTFTAAAGGIPIAGKTGATALPAGYNGLLAYDPASGSFYHMAAAGAQQARVLPFAPVVNVNGGADVNVPQASGQVQVCAATFTCDGNTDLMITARWAGLYQASPANTSGVAMLLLDGASVPFDALYFNLHASDVGGSGNAVNGQSWTTFTSSALSTTPSAGTHTVRLKFACQTTGQSFKVLTSVTFAPAYLRVAPVTL